MSELFDIAKAAHLAGDGERAIHLYRAAIEEDPADTGSLNNLAALLQGRRQNEAALILWRRAAAILPDDADLQLSLARSLIIARRFDEAWRILERMPCNRVGADVLHTQGLLAHLSGRLHDALWFYNEALSTDHGWLQAKWDRCLVLLSLGDYTSAWPDFDVCLEVFPQRRECLQKPMPLWRGEDLSGKRLWLYNEQGLGDCLAYLRFLPHLARHGRPEIILDVNKELYRLIEGTVDRAQVRPLGLPPPVADYQLPLGLLASRLGIHLESIVGKPYLPVPRTPTQPIADAFSVGICWSSGRNTGEGYRRNIPFLDLCALAADPAIRLYGFQVGPESEEIRRHGAEALVTDLSPFLTDYAMTAAYLARMDVLVTCDTSIAHCAGALGVKTLLLTPHDRAWIWHAQGPAKQPPRAVTLDEFMAMPTNHSDWYESVEVYVQEPPDAAGRTDWQPLIAQVSARIAEIVRM